MIKIVRERKFSSPSSFTKKCILSLWIIRSKVLKFWSTEEISFEIRKFLPFSFFLLISRRMHGGRRISSGEEKRIKKEGMEDSLNGEEWNRRKLWRTLEISNVLTTPPAVPVFPALREGRKKMKNGCWGLVRVSFCRLPRRKFHLNVSL